MQAVELFIVCVGALHAKRCLHYYKHAS